MKFSQVCLLQLFLTQIFQINDEFKITTILPGQTYAEYGSATVEVTTLKDRLSLMENAL